MSPSSLNMRKLHVLGVICLIILVGSCISIRAQPGPESKNDKVEPGPKSKNEKVEPGPESKNEKVEPGAESKNEKVESGPESKKEKVEPESKNEKSKKEKVEPESKKEKSSGPGEYSAINCRKHSASLKDFGGVGDGKTLNTKAFNDAIASLSKKASDGGAELVVPPGKWLTGSFNLTSHFTLFLHKDAVILASQDTKGWPIVAPLPSYGFEKAAPKGRYISLIFGTNLTDVVITGNNGTIDGQGDAWWGRFKKGEFDAVRPFLIEIMYSTQVLVSDITLKDSPMWNIHPVYCSDVIFKKVTIIAPVEVPNTDGINPDSCTNVLIEDCYIQSGDDCIAIKSGWDQYGIKMAMPTQHLVIKRFTCISPDSATIALGSEMSGGLQDIRAEDITAINTQSAVRIKTAPGRGGYIKDIFVRRMTLKTMEYVFWASGAYKTHPDDGWDRNAFSEVKNINFQDVVAENVTIPGALDGYANKPFTGFCISNVTMTLSEQSKKKIKLPWNCTYIEGVSNNVTPKPCPALPEKQAKCAFPEDKLPIETIKMQTCKAATST